MTDTEDRMTDLEEIRLLHDDASAPDPEAATRVWAQLAERIAAEGAAPGDSRAYPPRRPRRALDRFLPRGRGRAAAVAALAGVAATVAILTPDGAELPGGTSLREDASAATVLREAAAVARAAPAPAVPGPGEFLYTRSIDAYLGTSVYGRDLSFSVLEPHVRETWLGPRGGLLRVRTGIPRFVSARDREGWVAAGRPRLARNEQTEVRLPPTEPIDLPSDAGALYSKLKGAAGGSGRRLHEQMFTLIGDALRETASSPGQRAALYEVASRLPGIQLIGEMTDPAGRRGLAVAMDDRPNRVRHTLIFDPKTAVLLSEKQTALPGNAFGYPDGTVIGHATYVESRVVSALGERSTSGSRSDSAR
jgi:hypothetical protein